MNPSSFRRAGLLIAALAAVVPLHAQFIPPELDLTVLSPEELGELSVSAVSKHAEPLFASPSAVSAVTAAEADRYGFNSIADALRLVPGVQVSQESAYTWDIGIRGFVGITSTKLLVLMDGRTVYSPFYGGVDWSEANMQMQDLDRIEVVRGPGATLWGANAVNGVINIISKDARDTQGGYFSLRGGTADGLDANLRYGGEWGANTWYRVYVTDTDTRNAPSEPDVDGYRYAFSELRAGFRTDTETSDTLHLTFQGEVADLKHYETTPDPTTGFEVGSGDSHRPEDILGRLHWHDNGGDELTVQFYADATPDSVSPAEYAVPGGTGTFSVADRGGDFDLDITDRLKLGERDDLVWGGGFRWTLIDLQIADNSALSVQEPRVIQRLYNLFFQDEIVLAPDRLRLTAGSKLERDDYIGWQLLPSLRLAFTPSANQTWWLAASRAVRSPSSSERDVRINYQEIPAGQVSPLGQILPYPVLVALDGSSTFHQETLTAYEAGWRNRWGTTVTTDVTVYDNEYRDLRNPMEVYGMQFQPPMALVDLVAANTGRARGYGAEASANWRVRDGWTLAGSFTDERLIPKDLVFPELLAADYALPHMMGSLRSCFDLQRDLRLSIAVFGVSPLRTSEYGYPDLPGYWRWDAQVTWWACADLEFNAGVQNAFDGGHAEASPLSFSETTEIPRNVFAQAQWRF